MTAILPLLPLRAKHVGLLIAFPLLLAGSMPKVTAQQTMRDKIRRQVEKLIWFETEIDRDLTPGFIVGIVDGDSYMILPFGVRIKGGTDTISAHDVFELGSTTKAITACLFAELDAAGALSLETAFNTLLPEEFRNPTMAGITIGDILAHQSGLPRDPSTGSKLGNPVKFYNSHSRQSLLGEYRSVEGPQRMVYSNFGYALLNEALPGDYDELLNSYLTEKARFEETGTQVPVTAPGYNVYDSLTSPVEFGYFIPSGGLHSSAADLVRFVQYCLNSSPGTIWEVRGDGMSTDLKMALGWHVIKERHGTIYLHTGRTLGHTSFIGLMPETRTGVIILANSETGTDDLGMEVLRIMNNNWHRKN